MSAFPPRWAEIGTELDLLQDAALVVRLLADGMEECSNERELYVRAFHVAAQFVEDRTSALADLLTREPEAVADAA